MSAARSLPERDGLEARAEALALAGCAWAFVEERRAETARAADEVAVAIATLEARRDELLRAIALATDAARLVAIVRKTP